MQQAAFFELELQFLTEVREIEDLDRESVELADDLAAANTELADRLEGNSGSRFSAVWEELGTLRRPAHLAACISAVTRLLQEKGWLERPSVARNLISDGSDFGVTEVPS
jgi:hypothetical protein